MRGLQARTQLATHRIQVAIGVEESITTDSLLNAIQTAHEDGSRDALDGNNEPPAMFNNEPILLAAWDGGQETVLTLQEMNVSSGCRSHSGDPCPHHG